MRYYLMVIQAVDGYGVPVDVERLQIEGETIPEFTSVSEAWDWAGTVAICREGFRASELAVLVTG